MTAPLSLASLPPLQFRGQLRPSQQEVVAIAERKLKEGARKLHIVAPPGSGKTVTGLYLWAMCVKAPALVLSPNSAIQAQWAARTDLFQLASGEAARNLVSTDPRQPALLTSLTYQSVTLPGRGGGDIDATALDIWRQKLIERGQAKDPDEAEVWLEDLQRHNRGYYEQRFGAYRKQARDQAALGGAALKTLHDSALAALERLRGQGVGLIILDECHHLLGHWGRVLAHARELLADPVIVGLTATPPDKDGKDAADVARYEEFLGPVDFEVPVPAVVKDGFLAPYQDLAYFVRPGPDEIAYIANADSQLHALVEELCQIGPAGGAPLAPAADSAAAPAAPASPVERAPPAAAALRRASDLDEVPAPAAPASASNPSAPLPTAPQPAALHSAASAAPEAEGEAAEARAELPPQRESLPQWVTRVLAEKRLPAGMAKDWAAFERRDPDFAEAARWFLLARGLPLPEDVPPPDSDLPASEVPEMDFLVPVLDRFVRRRLRLSPFAEDRELAEQAIRRLRLLGVQITEVGWQPCASPVGRVMGYSKAKCEALVPVLIAERAALGDKLRAVVVADYEKTSAVTAEVSHLLTDEAGGAIAAFKTLISHPATDELSPVLVTGSSVLVDDDIADHFAAEARRWLAEKQFAVELEFHEENGFRVLAGQGADWAPRVYVEMITELFQRGVSRCLVGTRGLLGEGWDANKINVLIDLTTVTTSMTVNQLRGRSIRLDPAEPDKVANNWDVVCLAPEFTKGLDDYKRFIAKHRTLYGVADDGTIEKGVGHVHPAFTALKPELLEDSVQALNEDMLRRVNRRPQARELWKIGQPYKAEPIQAVEARPIREREKGGFPPFRRAKTAWSSSGLALAIGQAVLRALAEAELIDELPELKAGDRAGGYVRVFLEGASSEASRLFTQSLHEALGPLRRPRYVIPRYIDRVEDTWLSSVLPGFLGQYFQKRKPKRVMLHAVPAALAKNKELALIFQKHWNKLVSPGEAVYAYREAGEDVIAHVRERGLAPTAPVHEKEVFQ